LFYFNDLQATSAMVEGRYGSTSEELVYAVLTTPFREIQAAAICAFPMSEVRRVFAKGNFRLQEGTGGGYGLRMTDQDMMQPRPGGCSKNSKLLNDKVVNFIQRNPLMYDTVSNFFEQPLLVETSSKLRFTQIAVDSQVKSVDGRNYDVIFVGTEDGRLLKLVNTADGQRVRSVLIESTKVFNDAQPIKNLLVYRPNAEAFSAGGEKATPKIVSVSDEEIRALPLFYCQNQSSCGACLHLQDPYCAWDLIKAQCVGRFDGDWSNGDFVQSIETGRSSLCPEGEYYESPLYSFDGKLKV
jgi:semaphorin 6